MSSRFGEVMYKGFVTVFKGPTKHEVVQTTDSVGFIVYIVDREEVVFVKQNRAPMMSDENPEGLIVEVPAGRFDVNLSAQELIAKEAGEELGAKIHLDQVKLLNQGKPLAMSPGVMTEKMILGVVMIDSSQIEDQERIFGVDDNEQISRVFVKIYHLNSFVFDDLKTFCLVSYLLFQFGLKGE